MALGSFELVSELHLHPMDGDFKIIDSLRRTADPSKIPLASQEDTYRRNGPAERENGDRHQ